MKREGTEQNWYLLSPVGQTTRKGSLLEDKSRGKRTLEGQEMPFPVVAFLSKQTVGERAFQAEGSSKPRLRFEVSVWGLQRGRCGHKDPDGHRNSSQEVNRSNKLKRRASHDIGKEFPGTTEINETLPRAIWLGERVSYQKYHAKQATEMLAPNKASALDRLPKVHCALIWAKEPEIASLSYAVSIHHLRGPIFPPIAVGATTPVNAQHSPGAGSRFKLVTSGQSMCTY